MSNISDIEEARAARRRAKNKKKLTFYLAVLGLAILFVMFRRYLTADHISMVIGDTWSDFSTGNFPIVLSEGVPKSVNCSGKGFSVVTSTAFVAYNKNGAMVQNTPHNMQNPDTASQGRYKLVFDRGNHSFSLFSQTKKIYTLSSGQKILDGDVNAKGQAALATTSDRYLSQVTVYDTDGSDIFTWFSSTDYVISIDFEGNFLAVAAARAQDNQVVGQLYLLNIKKTDEIFCISYVNEAPLQVQQSGNFIALYTDKGYYSYNRKGELMGSHSFDNNTLQNTDTEAGSRMAFTLGSGTSLNRVIVVNRKGEVLCEIDPQAVVLGVHCCGNKTAVLLSDRLVIFDKEGTQTDEIQYAKTCLRLYANGKHLYIQASDSIIKETI